MKTKKLLLQFVWFACSFVIQAATLWFFIYWIINCRESKSYDMVLVITAVVWSVLIIIVYFTFVFFFIYLRCYLGFHYWKGYTCKECHITRDTFELKPQYNNPCRIINGPIHFYSSMDITATPIRQLASHELISTGITVEKDGVKRTTVTLIDGSVGFIDASVELFQLKPKRTDKLTSVRIQPSAEANQLIELQPDTNIILLDSIEVADECWLQIRDAAGNEGYINASTVLYPAEKSHDDGDNSFLKTTILLVAGIGLCLSFIIPTANLGLPTPNRDINWMLLNNNKSILTFNDTTMTIILWSLLPIGGYMLSLGIYRIIKEIEYNKNPEYDKLLIAYVRSQFRKVH